MTALPPPDHHGELAFAGTFLGAIYAVASFIPALLAGLPFWAVLGFPGAGYLIGAFLDRRPAS